MIPCAASQNTTIAKETIAATSSKTISIDTKNQDEQ